MQTDRHPGQNFHITMYLVIWQKNSKVFIISIFFRDVLKWKLLQKYSQNWTFIMHKRCRIKTTVRIAKRSDISLHI